MKPPHILGITLVLAGTATGAACSSDDPREANADTAPAITTAGTTSASASATPPTRPVDPEKPINPTSVSTTPTKPGGTFGVDNTPLPPILISGIIDGGGQTMSVADAINQFGVYGLPRPDASTSAVTNVHVNVSELPAGGSTATHGITYLANTPTDNRILLTQLANMLGTPDSYRHQSEYDGTLGGPDCGELSTTADIATYTIEGCDYREPKLGDLHSIEFTRHNLVSRTNPQLPPIFPDAAGDLPGTLSHYTATFGPPSGAAGATVLLEAHYELPARDVELQRPWQDDGSNRWWSPQGTVTVEDRQLVYRWTGLIPEQGTTP